MKKKTGLFFGSFNPPHRGHESIASYLTDEKFVDEICFIVSPQNPLKEQAGLAEASHRLAMIQLVSEKHPAFTASDVEFTMPLPSYTIYTLEKLRSNNPQKELYLIIGSDNLQEFHLWKDYRHIIKDYKILVYPRKNQFTNPYPEEPNIIITKAPLIEVSSTQIRQKISQGEDITTYVPMPVRRYIQEHNLYRP
jgi:nicotinate-nucleotide adenylyltransferase